MNTLRIAGVVLLALGIAAICMVQAFNGLPPDKVCTPPVQTQVGDGVVEITWVETSVPVQALGYTASILVALAGLTCIAFSFRRRQ